MSQQPQPQSQSKPAGYINVNAEVNALQRIMCCNYNIGNNAADTPRGNKKRSLQDDAPAQLENTVEVTLEGE